MCLQVLLLNQGKEADCLRHKALHDDTRMHNTSLKSARTEGKYMRNNPKVMKVHNGWNVSPIVNIYLFVFSV